MQLGNVGNLLRRCFPHSLAHCFEHNGSNLLQGSRIFLFKECFCAQFVLVLHVHTVYIVPQFLVYRLRFHDVPAVSILYNLCKTACCACSTFHFLLYIYRVQNGGTALYAYGFLHFLHANVVPIAIIAEVSIRVFARYLTHSEVQSAHKLVDMV